LYNILYNVTISILSLKGDEMKYKRRNGKNILKYGYSWGGTPPMWEEESEELADEIDEFDELEELRERNKG